MVICVPGIEIRDRHHAAQLRLATTLAVSESEQVISVVKTPVVARFGALAHQALTAEQAVHGGGGELEVLGQLHLRRAVQ